MLFSAKPKGFFVELSDHGCLFARTSTPGDGPLVVEELEECPAGDAEQFAQMLDKLQPKKSPSGYVHAVCGLYPSKRLLRRATIDPKRAALVRSLMERDLYEMLGIPRDAGEAEDVLQEVYVTVWRSASGYSPALGRPMTWLMSIARNRAIDSLRRRGREPDTVSRHAVAADGETEVDLLEQLPARAAILDLGSGRGRMHGILRRAAIGLSASIARANRSALATPCSSPKMPSGMNRLR